MFKGRKFVSSYNFSCIVPFVRQLNSKITPIICLNFSTIAIKNFFNEVSFIFLSFYYYSTYTTQ